MFCMMEGVNASVRGYDKLGIEISEIYVRQVLRLIHEKGAYVEGCVQEVGGVASLSSVKGLGCFINIRHIWSSEGKGSLLVPMSSNLDSCKLQYVFGCNSSSDEWQGRTKLLLVYLHADKF